MMVRKIIEIPIGTRFGMLTVIEKLPKEKYIDPKYRCACDCGNKNYIINKRSLLYKQPSKLRNCGCSRNYTLHSLSDHPIYNSWIKLIVHNKMNKIPFLDYYNYIISLGYQKGDTVYIRDRSSKNIINNIELSKEKSKFIHLASIVKDKHSSNFKGVTYNKKRRKYIANISVTTYDNNGHKTVQNKHVGYFFNEIEAIKARNIFILKNNLNIYALQSSSEYQLFDEGRRISYSLHIDQYDLIREDIKQGIPIPVIVKKYKL